MASPRTLAAASSTPGRLALLLSFVAVTACSSYPKQLSTTRPESAPSFVRFSRANPWPVEIEVAKRSHISLFVLGENVEMLYPLVPVSRLEQIYDAWLGPIQNEDLNTFRVRHPWPHPDSVPDPFAVGSTPLDAGRHDLERPFAPYVIQDRRSPLPCDYYLLIATDEAPEYTGLFELEFTRWTRNPEAGAERILGALGLELDGGGWSAVIEQGVCRRGGE